MQQLFADLPEAIANTLELSSRLEFTLNDLGYEFPRYPVPEGETMNSFLREQAWNGFRNRYGRYSQDMQANARLQIEKELALIEKLKLAGYFLIVWDLVRFCREQNILVQGRGSAANSAVCYSLGITAVDPVGMELLFERFLSEERGEWPDIDLDLPSGDEREKVIQYVYQRYGELGAAMTANVITYRGPHRPRAKWARRWASIADTLDKISAAGRHLGIPRRERRDSTAASATPGSTSTIPALRKFLELCIAVQDMPRHLGQHSGGMVICQGQLDSVVPLEPASMPGRVVVQWDKEDCADLGIIKVDLLGLGMMAVLEDSPRTHSRSLSRRSRSRPASAGRSAGLSRVAAGRHHRHVSGGKPRADGVLPRMRPEKFLRPRGAGRDHPARARSSARWCIRICSAARDKKRSRMLHPSLEPVLKRTLGVPLFQEQLLRMAMIAANFTGGEAEELRRAMGFKRSQAAHARNRSQAARRHDAKRHHRRKRRTDIVHSITSFALYGFPESHAASFALIAYASAYLKCHYLAAFTAALLNNQPMGFYSPATLVKDAQRHGLKLLPVDVTCSEWNCTLEAVQSQSQFSVPRTLSSDQAREGRRSRVAE